MTAARLRGLSRQLLWYLREVAGETAYDRYVAHGRQHHPDEPPLGRREWERRRMDARDRSPQSRCC